MTNLRTILLGVSLGIGIIACEKPEMENTVDLVQDPTTPNTVVSSPTTTQTSTQTNNTAQFCLDANTCFDTQAELEAYVNAQNSGQSTSTTNSGDYSEFAERVVIVGEGTFEFTSITQINDTDYKFEMVITPANGWVLNELQFGDALGNVRRVATLNVDVTGWNGHGIKIEFGQLIGDVIASPSTAHLVDDYLAIIEEGKSFLPTHLRELVSDVRYTIINSEEVFALYTADLNRISFSSAYLTSSAGIDALVRTVVHELAHTVDYKLGITENNAEVLGYFEKSKQNWFNGILPDNAGNFYPQLVQLGKEARDRGETQGLALFNEGDIAHYAHTNIREYFAELFAGVYADESEYDFWTPETVEQYENEMFTLITNL